jgi:hypothetical protein
MSPEYILKHNGHWVIDTHHAIDRMVQRGDHTQEALQSFFCNMIDRCITLKNWHSRPSNVEYFIWSKQLQQGFVVAYKLDFKQPKKDRKHFTIVTVYPAGIDKPRHISTDKITVK